MFRNIFAAASAGAALVIAAPLFAQPHGGGNLGAGIGAHGQGAINVSTMGTPSSMNAPTLGATTSFSSHSQAQVRSQGFFHASPSGISHASPNSVLARGSVSSSSLGGLTTGLSVNNSGGTSIGTVSRVITGTDGSIRQVIVTSPTGQTYRLAPTTLSISGGVVTTTSTSIRG
jgi:hypothetical protein